MAKKEYDIAFGIYDRNEEDWIIEDGEFTIEIKDSENINADDFFSFFRKMISIIENYEIDLKEDQEEEEEKEEKGENNE